jgi:signal transduction histidine kinase
MDGLNRFDGLRFRRIGERTTTSPGLSRSAIAGVCEDNEGKLLVTFQGIYGYFDRLDPKDFSVEQIRLAPSTGVLGHPRAITTDTLGRTFVVTIGTDGTYLYEYTPNAKVESKTFTPIYHEPTDAWTTLAPRVALLAHSSGQFLLFDEEHGFRHISAAGKSYGNPFGDRTDLRRFYTFAEAANGNIFVSFRGGIPLFSWYPTPGQDPVPVNTDNSGLRYPAMFLDQLGQIIMPATEDILGRGFPDEYALVDTEGKFSIFEKPLPTERLVSTMAAVDFRETTYLGLREGLGVVERYDNSVATFLEQTKGGDIFPNRMRGMAEDKDGKVYIMEEDGAVYSKSPGQVQLDTLILTDAEDSTRVINFRAGASLVYDSAEHALWGAAQLLNLQKGGILFRYDVDLGTTQEYRLNYAPQAMAFGPDRKLYLTVTDPRAVGILLRFDPTTGKCLPVVRLGEEEPLLSGLRLNCLATGSNGRLLIGTDKRGVLALDLSDLSLTEHSNFSGDAAGAEEGFKNAGRVPEDILTIFEAANDTWWLGTDAGLVHYLPLQQKATHYGRQEGLSNNVVYGILPDSSGGLWLSTENGLTYMPKGGDPGSFRRYYREDGLSNDEFLPFSFLRGKNGRYYFGGVNGLTTFREEDLSSSTAGSDVMLTEINILGRNSERSLVNELGNLKQVTVLAGEKSVAISFALPAGQLPSSSQFRYRLEGFNDDWVPLVSERTIRFNNLRSGRYPLRIQGAGANGNYGERELNLTLNVRQYLVERRWFQILCVLAFAGLIFYILQAKLRERLRNEQLRTQLSADIHDEVSGLLAGITLQAELLKNKTDDKKLQARLHTVGEAGRSAMSKMSDVIWSIDSRRDTIGNLLQRMQEHADEVLHPLDIRYDFKASGLDKNKELAGNIRQDLYFIFKEAINNIARHSNATQVNIEVEQYAQLFELFIRDNGKTPVSKPGPESSLSTRVRAQKTGQGKDNMRMRAERLKGEISIDERGGYTLVFRMRRLG